MPSHTVPRSGLPIDFAQKPLAANNIIGLTLTDDAIEKMIAAVQGGEDMQLSFGPEPVSRALLYQQRSVGVLK